MEDFGTHSQCFTNVVSTDRAYHKLLECDRSIRVCTAIDDVHHWNRQCIGIDTTDIAVQRHIQSLGCCLCYCQRNAENSVSAKLTLGRSTIECQHHIVDCALVGYAETFQFGRNNIVYVLYCLQNTLTAKTFLVAIAKFECFVFTCRCT